LDARLDVKNRAVGIGPIMMFGAIAQFPGIREPGQMGGERC
jgi:hypothetical protein